MMSLLDRVRASVSRPDGGSPASRDAGGMPRWWRLVAPGVSAAGGGGHPHLAAIGAGGEADDGHPRVVDHLEVQALGPLFGGIDTASNTAAFALHAILSKIHAHYNYELYSKLEKMQVG